jgi:hypothetical protein
VPTGVVVVVVGPGMVVVVGGGALVVELAVVVVVAVDVVVLEGFVVVVELGTVVVVVVDVVVVVEVVVVVDVVVVVEVVVVVGATGPGAQDEASAGCSSTLAPGCVRAGEPEASEAAERPSRLPAAVSELSAATRARRSARVGLISRAAAPRP